MRVKEVLKENEGERSIGIKWRWTKYWIKMKVKEVLDKNEGERSIGRKWFLLVCGTDPHYNYIVFTAKWDSQGRKPIEINEKSIENRWKPQIGA